MLQTKMFLMKKVMIDQLNIAEMLDTFNSMMDNIIEAYENKDSKIAKNI